MELKVWVDGIPRVVCGITEQTTVQEVVIALAQATGRTGRYALMERWRTMEKMLPPSNHPLQVLRKWEDRAKEVQLVLKRTGASSVSESEESNAMPPERSTYRQSLPPQLKHREKREAILNRKEPKRKSLNITAAGSNDNTANRSNTVVIEDRKNATGVLPDPTGRAMQTSSKKALIPPPFRNNSVPPQKLQVSEQNTSSNNAIANEATPTPYRHIPTPIPQSPIKKPLMPPQMRNDYILKTPVKTTHQSAGHGQYILHQRGSSNGSGDKSSQPMWSNAGIPTRSSVHSKPNDTVKARSEFTRLVLEQQGHVNEQTQTLKSLDKEMESCQAVVQSRVKTNAVLQKEIESLERTMKQNEADLLDGDVLQRLLQEEGSKGNNLLSENAKFQSQVSSVNESLKQLEKKIIFLQKEIERESDIQEQKRKDIFRNRYELTELNLKKANENSWKTVSALGNVEDGINKAEALIYEKQMKLEALNRELRQVNLQQFIRQTGSKVTVLPPDAEKNAADYDQITSPINHDVIQDKNRSPRSGEEPGGVWV